MFCADYISAYIYHAAINVYLHQKEKDEFIVTVLTKDPFFTGILMRSMIARIVKHKF